MQTRNLKTRTKEDIDLYKNRPDLYDNQIFDILFQEENKEIVEEEVECCA